MNDTSSVESLIDRYIVEHDLSHGSLLPPTPELASQLRCQENDVIEALHAAERQLKVSYENEKWVVTSAVLRDHRRFSFTESAAAHGRKLETHVTEKNLRIPRFDPEHHLHFVERTAQKALGLAENSPFLVIERFRLLEKHPAALQIAYLDPSRFPPDFLDRHNFGTESLIDLYQHYGYKLLFRDTVLVARSAVTYELSLLEQYYKSERTGRAVLDAEQQLYAQDPATGSRFVLEFLKASYLGNWRYEVKNRPAAIV